MNYCFSVRFLSKSAFKQSYAFYKDTGAKTYLIKNSTAEGYLYSLFYLPHDWVINVDEDAFIFDKEKLFGLLQFMKENDYDICGFRDGGFLEIRGGHPLAINPFFTIINTGKIRKRFNLEKINTYTAQSIVKNIPGEMLENLPAPFDVNSNYEPYYKLFFWLFDEQFKFLYLNATIWNNDPGIPWEDRMVKFATILKDHNNNDFLMHCWFSRSRTVKRINLIYKYALSLSPGIKPISRFWFMPHKSIRKINFKSSRFIRASNG